MLSGARVLEHDNDAMPTDGPRNLALAMVRAVTRRGRRLRERLWAESPRSWAAAGVAIVLGLVGQQLLIPSAGPGLWAPRMLEGVLLIMALYQSLYVVLTLVVLGGADGDDVDRAARTMPPRSWVHRWIYLTEPGAGATLSVAVLAMGAAVVVLPRTERFTADLSGGALTALCLLLIVSAWATMVITYAVDYLRLDHHRGGLDFPGGGRRAFADYLYLSLASATTFGTTDVAVTTSQMRRVVMSQGLAAFVFNTVILALSISALAR